MKDDAKILIFHGYGSSCENPRYKNLQYDSICQDIDYSSSSWEDVYSIFDSIIIKNLFQKENLILLGHSLGGWWARYFAKKYNLTAILLNPVLYFPIPISINNKEYENYEKNQIYFDYNSDCELWYYIELGDEVINYSPSLLELIRKEGTVITISGGHHRIQYPEMISYLVNRAIREQGTTI